jgi:hypothetical protein
MLPRQLLTILHIMADKKEPIYIRVGIDYYLKDFVPGITGKTKEMLIKWNKATIIDDHKREYLQQIDCYKAFCTIPSHTNYQPVIHMCYNRYHKLSHVLKEGDISYTTRFLKHIFNDQYGLAIDYFGILWKHPNQILPILSLVSTERNTGKTTFLNWLKAVFESNMTINKNEDFRSQFNSDWADKLIVGIDEVLLDKKEDSELLKSLSTARHFKSESKGNDKREIDFFGKFILCSNNEDTFVKIDPEEIRYWVVKVPQLKDDDPLLLDKLIEEIPHFLYHIDKREIVSQKKTRMWFTKEQIWTEALDVLKKGNKTFVEKQLIETIEDELDKFDVKEIRYSIGDLIDLMNKNNLRISGFQITKLLKEKWNMQSKNTTYKKYYLVDSSIDNKPASSYTNDKGRVFTFSKEILQHIRINF